MRFIIDAHLPISIARIFSDLGYKSIHTRDLPQGNATSDNALLNFAGADGVIVSKDEDFYLSFLINQKPSKLILIKVGNMKLKEITSHFKSIAPKIIDLLLQHDLLEIHKDKIIAIV